MLNVSVYNRHRSSCSHKSERFYKRCDCPKWVTWHREGKEHRISADSCDWDVASQKARRIEDDLRGVGSTPDQYRMTVEGAVKAFLTDRESQHLAPSTISKLTTLFQKQFVPWCEFNGLTYLRQITLPHLQAWRADWHVGPLASKKMQERVIGFFYFCQRNKWVIDNPALGLSRIKADTHQADYFTPEEFSKILGAIEGFGKTDEQRRRLRGMVFLLRWSGLAIRDAVTLERSALGDDDRLILRRVKTGVPVMLPLQTNVAAILRNLPNSNPRYFFWTGRGLPKSAVADWQRALRRLFVLADLKHADGTKKRCHAHMFRHTCSIMMLLSGVPVEDVARLLGHSSIKTTEKYYSSWVKARADRLEESVKASWLS